MVGLGGTDTHWDGRPSSVSLSRCVPVPVYGYTWDWHMVGVANIGTDARLLCPCLTVSCGEREGERGERERQREGQREREGERERERETGEREGESKRERLEMGILSWQN